MRYGCTTAHRYHFRLCKALRFAVGQVRETTVFEPKLSTDSVTTNLDGVIPVTIFSQEMGVSGRRRASTDREEADGPTRSHPHGRVLLLVTHFSHPPACSFRASVCLPVLLFSLHLEDGRPL